MLSLVPTLEQRVAIAVAGVSSSTPASSSGSSPRSRRPRARPDARDACRARTRAAIERRRRRRAGPRGYPGRGICARVRAAGAATLLGLRCRAAARRPPDRPRLQERARPRGPPPHNAGRRSRRASTGRDRAVRARRPREPSRRPPARHPTRSPRGSSTEGSRRSTPSSSGRHRSASRSAPGSNQASGAVRAARAAFECPLSRPRRIGRGWLLRGGEKSARRHPLRIPTRRPPRPSRRSGHNRARHEEAVIHVSLASPS